MTWHNSWCQPITSRAGQPSANGRPVCPPQKTNQVLTVPGPCFVMSPGPHEHDTWDMGHCCMIDHLDFVSFYGFPKPIKNTQHTITALCGESFLFCQWVSWCDLKISLGHYLNNLVPPLNQGCKLVLFQSCNSICRLLFFCQSNLKRAENVKSDLWLFIFVTAGGTLGLSQIFTTKIKSEPPDIILSIGLVIWSQAWISKIRINRDHSIESRS